MMGLREFIENEKIDYVRQKRQDRSMSLNEALPSGTQIEVVFRTLIELNLTFMYIIDAQYDRLLRPEVIQFLFIGNIFFLVLRKESRRT